jgi:hypothetical protein
MDLTVAEVIAILAASMLSLGLMLILWRRRPLLDRGWGDRIISYALGFAVALSLMIFVIMVEALVKLAVS